MSKLQKLLATCAEAELDARCAEPGTDSPRRRKRDKGTAFFNIGRNQEAGLRMSDTERRQLECEKVRPPGAYAPPMGGVELLGEP